MKRTLFLSAAALLGLVWAGCTPDELSDGSTPKETTITLSLAGDAESAEGATRVNFNEDYETQIMVVTWSTGDKIAIYGSADDTNPDVFTLSNGANTATGTFTGTLTKTGASCIVVYPYVEGKKSDEVLEYVLLDTQTGYGHLQNYDVIMGRYNAETNVVSSFEHQISIIRFHVPADDGEVLRSLKGVGIRGVWGDKVYFAATNNATFDWEWAHIVVPAVNVPAGTTLYQSVYIGDYVNVYPYFVENGGDMHGKLIYLGDPDTPITYSVSGVYANHEYVTIDGLNWATCNVGTCLPWEMGDELSFGSFEKTGANYGGSEDIQGRTDLVLKDGTTIGGDVAAYRWGHGWKMPKANQSNEALDHLLTKKMECDVLSGSRGAKFGTSPSNYIFLPFETGHAYGEYWSSSPNGDDALYLYFSDNDLPTYNHVGSTRRYYSQLVRPLVDLSE